MGIIIEFLRHDWHLILELTAALAQVHFIWETRVEKFINNGANNGARRGAATVVQQRVHHARWVDMCGDRQRQRQPLTTVFAFGDTTFWDAFILLTTTAYLLYLALVHSTTHYDHYRTRPLATPRRFTGLVACRFLKPSFRSDDVE